MPSRVVESRRLPESASGGTRPPRPRAPVPRRRPPITRGGQPKLQNKSKIMIQNLSNYLKSKVEWRMAEGPEVDTDRLHETIHASMSTQPLWRPQEYAFDEALVQL